MTHGIEGATTIIGRVTSLASLPPASLAVFQGRPPWGILTTAVLVSALEVDRGNFATWRCRGIGPAELPAFWFKPAPGQPCYYRIDQALAWIAARRGEEFETLSAWRAYFHNEFDYDIADPGELRRQARLLALAAGPVNSGVRFTREGFTAYLDSLDLERASLQA